MIRSHPLAGTAPITGDPDNDERLAAELIASTKNQVEHRTGDRDGARHLVAMVQLSRLGAGAVDREGGERAAPRIACRGPPVEPGAERARAGPGAVADAGRRRPSPIARARPDRVGRRVRARPVRWRRWLGRRLGTARGRSRSAVRSCRTIGTRHASSPAAESSPTAIRSPSSPRPRPSSKPCSPPSSAPEAPNCLR